MKEDRVVSKERGKALADELGIRYFFETSAKNSTNVRDAFMSMATQAQTEDFKTRPKSGNEFSPESWGCCYR
eukprot:TRINITY_DN12908_c0_g1_i1.p1 TRINITY_DN12908_c0_g1~~TRINITY_DN12908_c0_g1_i1.p1  ORF type:complete len:72 (+),score=7.18 TRINITY_DN12908_c0_g1_i1:239-454(+)